MPLTPADVHNVAFSKPPIGKRGYNEDEVDAFLDRRAVDHRCIRIRQQDRVRILLRLSREIFDLID